MAARLNSIVCIAVLCVLLTPASAGQVRRPHLKPSKRAAFTVLVNRAREHAHVRRDLAPNRRLARQAQQHSRTMAAWETLDHDGFHERAVAAGFNATGEVLAQVHVGPFPARRALRQYLGSPPHRTVLLNPRYGNLGIGIARKGRWLYWTVLTGGQ